MIIKRTDQYGDPIPDDLVTMPNVDLMYATDIQAVYESTWYEAVKILLVSAEEIDYLSEGDPLDSGIDLSNPKVVVNKVDRCLHRFSFDEGFYHA